MEKAILGNDHIVLADGRKLGYAEYGVKNGFPIVYCHGSQSSRLEMHFDMSFAAEHGLRIVSIDRPGHGNSDFNSKGTIRSFANDVDQLVEQLEIAEFSVLGMSAGAPFAMGIADCLNPKSKRLGIVSGFAPFNHETQRMLGKDVRFLLKLARSFPVLLKLMLKVQHWQLRKNPDSVLKKFLKGMSDADQKVLKNKAVWDVLERTFREAFKNGSHGVAYEMSNILVRDWDFELGDIAIPTFIWHGEKDNNAPKEWAMWVHEKIQNSRLKVYPNEGHLMVFKNAVEIFTTLK